LHLHCCHHPSFCHCHCSCHHNHLCCHCHHCTSHCCCTHHCHYHLLLVIVVVAVIVMIVVALPIPNIGPKPQHCQSMPLPKGGTIMIHPPLIIIHQPYQHGIYARIIRSSQQDNIDGT
jgi:hypothetical protein